MSKFVAAKIKIENQLHIFNDKNKGIIFVIAICGNKYNKSIGGCRLASYSNLEEMVQEACSLARGMYYKNSLFDLPFNGGKAIALHNITNRKNFFAILGQFINSLSGQYVTGIDAGVSQRDIDMVSKYTTYIAQDCAEATAYGVIESIKQVVQLQEQKSSLQGIKVSIQGIGKVGSILAKKLYNLGVDLIVSDINTKAIEQIKKVLPVKVVNVDSILGVYADIFCPCALGGILSVESAKNINSKIILGPANNQIVSAEASQILWERKILHIPESIVSAGGVIFAAYNYMGQSYTDSMEKVKKISDVLEEYWCLHLRKPGASLDIIHDLYRQKNIKIIDS